ncbi:uncharacterized protein LOC117179967 [Belonocnema kinseyi]|uniref:uncharacterized protein LOC117179967 n=1 Tax=Belonocnema kinseyi TaxID=2817044 RepID=UPI00143DD164|nr:uncharacterized protein LOC117179967 [Belonocnema kinseyi]
MGKTALTSHAKGSKHGLKLKFQKESSKVDRFLTQNSTAETTAVVSASAKKGPSEGLNNALKDSGSMLKNFLTTEKKSRELKSRGVSLQCQKILAITVLPKL